MFRSISTQSSYICILYGYGVYYMLVAMTILYPSPPSLNHGKQHIRLATQCDLKLRDSTLEVVGRSPLLGYQASKHSHHLTPYTA